MSTIRDIARMAGVSVSTASLALNGDPRVRPETRERVVDSATSLDYHPVRAARSLSSGRTWAIQLLNPGIDGSLSSGFFARFVRGMHDAARDHGYSVTLSVPASETEARAVLKRLMAERWADGVILTNPSEHDTLLEDVVSASFPHVLLGRSPVPGVTTVDNDNVCVAHDATAHLLAHGRRRLVLVNGSAKHTFTRDRAEGFALAHRRAGIEPQADSGLFENANADDARRHLNDRLTAGLELDGLVAVSDSLALGAMRALAEHGLRVPEDVAVVGMNNDDLTEFTNPTLSSIELNAFELGRTSAELLIKAITRPLEGAERRIVDHRLVTRDSSRAMRFERGRERSGAPLETNKGARRS